MPNPTQNEFEGVGQPGGGDEQIPETKSGIRIGGDFYPFGEIVEQDYDPGSYNLYLDLDEETKKRAVDFSSEILSLLLAIGKRFLKMDSEKAKYERLSCALFNSGSGVYIGIKASELDTYFGERDVYQRMVRIKSFDGYEIEMWIRYEKNEKSVYELSTPMIQSIDIPDLKVSYQVHPGDTSSVRQFGDDLESMRTAPGLSVVMSDLISGLKLNVNDTRCQKINPIQELSAGVSDIELLRKYFGEKIIVNGDEVLVPVSDGPDQVDYITRKTTRTYNVYNLQDKVAEARQRFNQELAELSPIDAVKRLSERDKAKSTDK